MRGGKETEVSGCVNEDVVYGDEDGASKFDGQVRVRPGMNSCRSTPNIRISFEDGNVCGYARVGCILGEVVGG